MSSGIPVKSEWFPTGKVRFRSVSGLFKIRHCLEVQESRRTGRCKGTSVDWRGSESRWVDANWMKHGHIITRVEMGKYLDDNE